MLVAATLISGCATRAPLPITINLVALNDFHGNLEAHKFEYKGAGETKTTTIQAGGIDAMGAALAAWRREDPQLLVVAAGDLIGASPALSSMWADEPTLSAMDLLGLDASSVGNHEFDQGRVELLRQQNGGCVSPRPDKACKFDGPFAGARFRYLAANVLDTASGAPLLPAYRIEERQGVKIAFIGAVLRGTDAMVLASGIAGLTFIDEADAVNAAVARARAEGATVFVLLIHEGGDTKEAFNQPGCEQLKGPIVGIARRLDPAVRLIVSGHTHHGYLCKVDNRTITQAEMGGHVLSRIRLTIDPASRAVVDVDARNVVMEPGRFAPAPVLDGFLAKVRLKSTAALSRPIARVGVRAVTREKSDAGESALGDVIADGVLSATAALGAQIGFMNTGGMRQDFQVGADGVATYGQAQVVLPFGNTLVLMDMTGAQLRGVLDQQWLRPHADSGPSFLQVSKGFGYRWNAGKPKGARVVPGSLVLNGAPIDEAKVYRVAVNNFLAEGGDSFALFGSAARKVDSGVRDTDAFISHLARLDQAGTPLNLSAPAGRIVKEK
jgi:5'-nucleotidase